MQQPKKLFKNDQLNAMGVTAEAYYTVQAAKANNPFICKECGEEPASTVHSINPDLDRLCWVCRRLAICAIWQAAAPSMF